MPVWAALVQSMADNNYLLYHSNNKVLQRKPISVPSYCLVGLSSLMAKTN